MAQLPYPLWSAHLRSSTRGEEQTSPLLTVSRKHHHMHKFMDDGAKRWLYKYAKKNYWRIAAWHEFDDLIQFGYVEYAEVLHRYPQATEPSHKMRLFQLCFRSKIEDLVRANSKQIDDARSDIVEIFDGDAVLFLDSFDLRGALLKAPQIIKEALALFTNEKMREELQKPFIRYDNGRRETLNDRWCNLLGKDPSSIDVVQELKMYFS